MRTVKIGRSPRPVAAVGLGCMGLSWAYTDASQTRADRVAFLRDAVDAGVDVFDTSDQYGPFTNEELIGEALQGRRDRVYLATKGGLVVDAGRGTTRDGSPAHLRAAFDASLERLRTDRVDLYQLHRVDPATPLERSWEALAGLVESGRVSDIGLSEVTVDEIERARAIHPVASVQSELSLWSPSALRDVVPYCAEHGIAFIAYSPLGRGFLSGTIAGRAALPDGDWRRGNPRFQPAAAEANTMRFVEPLRACADELAVTPAQVALAWVLAAGDHVVTIPGTQRLCYLRDNLAAGDVKIPAEWMERFARTPEAVGERY
jgi:aryl-alcohol dehydrogenase-like predicted oxidoreductase